LFGVFGHGYESLPGQSVGGPLGLGGFQAHTGQFGLPAVSTHPISEQEDGGREGEQENHEDKNKHERSHGSTPAFTAIGVNEIGKDFAFT
jgi:hypothetical protein